MFWNRLTRGTIAEVTAELEWTRMVMKKPAMRRSSSVAKGGTWGMSWESQLTSSSVWRRNFRLVEFYKVLLTRYSPILPSDHDNE